MGANKKNELIDEMISYRMSMQVIEMIMYTNGNTYSVCPGCDIPFEHEYQNFCASYGQKLGWDDFNNVRIRRVGEAIRKLDCSRFLDGL